MGVWRCGELALPPSAQRLPLQETAQGGQPEGAVGVRPATGPCTPSPSPRMGELQCGAAGAFYVHTLIHCHASIWGFRRSRNNSDLAKSFPFDGNLSVNSGVVNITNLGIISFCENELKR